MRQAKHSRSSSSGPTGRRAKSRGRVEGTRAQAGGAMKRGDKRAGSVKELAQEAWSGVEAGESEAGSSGSRRSRSSSRAKEMH